MKKHYHPRWHSLRLDGRSADRPTKRRLIRDVDHFRGVKAARTRLIRETTAALLDAFECLCDSRRDLSSAIRRIMEDVL